MPLFGAIIEVFCQTLKTISWFKTFSMRLQGSSEPMSDYFYHDSVNQVSREDCVKWQYKTSSWSGHVYFFINYMKEFHKKMSVYIRRFHTEYIFFWYIIFMSNTFCNRSWRLNVRMMGSVVDQRRQQTTVRNVPRRCREKGLQNKILHFSKFFTY